MSSLAQAALGFAASATANATLAKGKHNPVNATSGNLTMTLPTGVTVGSILAVEKTDATVNTVTISGTIRGSAGTSVLYDQNEVRYFVAETTSSWRPVGDHRSKASLDARYAARTGSVAAIPAISYWAHRGGAGFAPEETLPAYQASAALGADVLDMDVQPLGDGALALMHDTTVDRTTNTTGATTGFSTPAFLALNAAAKFPWNGVAVPPAMLTDVLRGFGGVFALTIEPKDTSNAAAIMDACDRLSLARSVLIATSSITVATAAKARGYLVYYYWGAASITSPNTLADIMAVGVDWLGCSATQQSDANITALVASGVPVNVFDCDRRVTRDHALTLGVKSFLSNQFAYLKATTAMRTTDSWRQGVLGHGANLAVNLTAYSINAGALVLSATGGSQYATVGEVCPLANAAATYHIDVDLTFDTLPTSTSGAFVVAFGLPDDGSYSFVTSFYPATGWFGYLRSNGVMSLFKMTGGVATNVGSVTTAALVAGATAHMRIDVTPTAVTVTRTDVTTPNSVTVTDSANRGANVQVGKSAADSPARFANLTVT